MYMHVADNLSIQYVPSVCDICPAGIHTHVEYPLPLQQLNMKWFGDGVAAAIAACRQDGALFIVYVCGEYKSVVWAFRCRVSFRNFVKGGGQKWRSLS